MRVTLDRCFSLGSCQVHSVHKPSPHVTEVHHIWPLAYGGPNVAENTIVVCPTGHTNIHYLLSTFIADGGNIPHQHLRLYAPSERQLAKLGYERMCRGSM
jgi:hypothetical protein